MTANAFDIDGLRARFSIFSERTYLNSATKGCMPSGTEGVVLGILETWKTEGVNWALWLDHVDSAKRMFAGVVGVPVNACFVSAGVSIALAQILSSLSYRQRPELLLLEDDFPTLSEVCRGLAVLGAEVKMVQVPRGEDATSCLIAELGQRTRAVVVSWSHHTGKWEIDLDRLAEGCNEKDVLTVVDGYHSIGVTWPLTGVLKVDALVTGTMKYLLGLPGGFALAYCSSQLVDDARPLITGWLGSQDPFRKLQHVAGRLPGAGQMEAGLASIVSAAVAAQGIRLLRDAGLRDIAGHSRELAAGFELTLVDLGVRCRRAGSLVCFPSVASETIVSRLRDAAVDVGIWNEWVRVSFHGYNSKEDADRLTEEILRLPVSPRAS